MIVMTEKQLLGSEAHIIHVRHHRKAKRAAIAWIIAAVMCAGLFWRQSDRVGRCRHHHQLQHDGELIKWNACGEIGDHMLECSSLDVPMDHFDEETSGNKTFTLPLIRLRAHNATKSLFLNPGGPGGSGIEFLRRAGGNLNTIVGEGYHLLSFEPRGVGRSQPQALCYPDPGTRQKLSTVHDKHIVTDSPDIWAWSSNFAKSCSDTMGEHGKYINTPQTAADMNSILDAVGQDKLAYWGFSYGTLLGQTYASLFPDRAERVVIDGVVNMFEWYDSPFFHESLMDTEDVLHGFLDECVKAGSNCSLSSLANSTEELQQKVFAFAENLKHEPISVYVNNTLNGIFDYTAMWFGAIFPAMYSPAKWPALADNLAKLMQGNATEAYIAYGQQPPFADAVPDDSNQFVVFNDGVSGPEQWPRDRIELLGEILAYVNTTSFAAFENTGFYERRAWDVPHTHSFVPTGGVQTAHPLLILSTTYDPVCPLISARAARDAFEGSRVVEVKGYGHCSIAMPSLCMAKHLRNFLNDGELPSEDSRCERDGLYYPKLEEKIRQAEWLGYDLEDRRIHEAQAAIAQDIVWPKQYPF